MAQFGQMERVELNNGAAPVVQLKWLAQNNNKAHRIGALVYQNGEELALGGQCSGTAILADGSTVPLTGAVSGNQAYVELNSACYTVEGTIIVSVTWISGQLQTTLLWAVGTVKITNTGTVIQPGDPIPNLEQLMAQITAMQEATAAANTAAAKAVQYGVDQTAQHTAAEKAQARLNIQAAHYSDSAPLFSSETDYAAGDLVMYEGELRAFLFAHPAGAWIGTDTKSTTLDGEIDQAKGSIASADVSTIKNYPLIQQGYITTDTILWNDRISGGNRCAIIPVSAGNAISITGGDSYYTMIAALKTFNSPTTGDAPDFSAATGWTSTIRVNAGGTFAGTSPADAAYLYVWLGNANPPYNMSRSPASVIIDGYDYAKSGADNIRGKAPIDSPAFTGTPTAPTQNAGDNSTKLATTAYADASSDAAEQAAVNRCMTIGEGDAVTLQDNTNIDTLLTPAIYKVTTSDHAATMQGNPPTKEVAYRLVVMETTQTKRLWQIALGNANLNPRIRKYNGTTWSEWNVLAYINSPAFTGNPTAPTQNAGDNSTKLATTAYADRAAKSAALGELTKNGIYSATDDEHVIKNYAIDSGVWVHGTSQNCSIIPVTPGDYVIVQANTVGNSSIAVLTQYPEPVSGSTPPFSGQTGFTGTITITKGTEQAFTMPTDAAYLYIYLRVLENGAYQRLPAHLLINGYDYAHTIADNISNKAPIDSPAFTGTPTAPTQEAGNNSTAVATTAYVDRAAAASAPVKIRVMQNNLGKMNNGESLAGDYHLLNTDNYQTILENYKSLYSKYQPDLIGYEEFVAEADIYTTGETPAVDHTENLITALYERLYPNIRYPTSAQVTSKLGILSKYPIIDYSRMRIDFTFQWEGQTESSYVFIIYGHVNVGGKPLAYCINTMTQDDNRQKGVAKRAALLPLILNMFANDDYAMMIADVNNGGTGQSKTSLEYSTAEANDLYNNIIKPAGFETVMGSYFGYSQTWESFDYHYIGSIDNIYYKNNGKIVFSGLQVLTEEATGLASDHVPIIADFTLL